MKIRTSELTGDALDHTVTSIEQGEYVKKIPYSTDWRWGGAILEKVLEAGGTIEDCYCVIPSVTLRGGSGSGPTTLIAVMRCYVESQIGDEVDVPDVLSASQPASEVKP